VASRKLARKGENHPGYIVCIRMFDRIRSEVLLYLVFCVCGNMQSKTGICKEEQPISVL